MLFCVYLLDVVIADETVSVSIRVDVKPIRARARRALSFVSVTQVSTPFASTSRLGSVRALSLSRRVIFFLLVPVVYRILDNSLTLVARFDFLRLWVDLDLFKDSIADVTSHLGRPPYKL